MQNHALSVVLVDDEVSSRIYLRDLLAHYGYITIVSEAATAQEGFTAIQKHRPDIVFLDVEMPCSSGFDLIHEMDKQGLHPVIIFVTGYERYAIEAIKHAAFDYLLKPVDPAELEKALKRYRQETIRPQLMHEKINLLVQTLANHRKISFNVRSGVVFIDPEHILYCRADGNYSSLVMENNHEEMVTCQIGNLYDQLPADVFLRVGRSLIINRQRIDRINRTKQTVIFENKESFVELKLSSRLIRELSKEISL